jgi:hypothetical protein
MKLKTPDKSGVFFYQLVLVFTICQPLHSPGYFPQLPALLLPALPEQEPELLLERGLLPLYRSMMIQLLHYCCIHHRRLKEHLHG